MMSIRLKHITIAFIFIWASVFPLYASDTMLMFVGEDLEVLSIASRKEEAAWSAPAIAKVVTRKDILETGAKTLADILGGVAGFHVEPTHGGSIPYLRGISNSALVLFDTVPMMSGVEKNNHLMDHETSLASIKRVEIIRGAGSVLWGPDAFAGVVNAVPFTGKDFSGLETGLTLSSADRGRQAFMRYGSDHGPWSSFLSVSARQAEEDDASLNVRRFWNDGLTPSPVSERFGPGEPDDSHYIDVYYHATVSDWLSLSARISDSRKAFSMADWDLDHIWEEQKSVQSRQFKIEARKDIGIDAGLRLTGYYSTVDRERTVIDRSFDQNEDTLFGEIIYERSLFGADGLLTVGASYKEDHFDDILVWESFFPGYIIPDNQYFFPEFSQNDYDNALYSIFGQYRQKIRNIELWAGVRSDGHEQFEDKISISSGLAWSLSPEYIFKASYGSGYRTPFAKQLAENGHACLEQIQNINFQLQYKPDSKSLFALTLFQNDIDDHVVGDRYEGAGLSVPNSQTIEGIELEWEFDASDRLTFFGNATFLANEGPAEIFLFNDYTYVDDEGNVQKHYQTLTHPYDTGSDIMLNFSLAWDITDNIRIVPRVRYFSPRELYYSVGNEIREYPEAWLCDLQVHISDFRSCDVSLFVNNLFNTRFRTFDAASTHYSESLNAGLIFRYHW